MMEDFEMVEASDLLEWPPRWLEALLEYLPDWPPSWLPDTAPDWMIEFVERYFPEGLPDWLKQIVSLYHPTGLPHVYVEQNVCEKAFDVGVLTVTLGSLVVLTWMYRRWAKPLNEYRRAIRSTGASLAQAMPSASSSASLGAEKSEVLSEDLVNVEKRVELIKQVCQNLTKKLQACLQGQGIDGPAIEKRMKKMPDMQLANCMSESCATLAAALGEQSLFGAILNICGNTQKLLGNELLDYEVEVEKKVINKQLELLENDIPAVAKQKKHLNKLTLDMDSAKTRYQTAARHSVQGSGNLPNKVEVIKEELDDASFKVEQCRDQLASDMFALVAQESDLAQQLFQLVKTQAEYHRKALNVLDNYSRIMEEEMRNHPGRPMFGVPLEEHLKVTDRQIASPIETCVCFLLCCGIEEEGLLRVAGTVSKVKKLKAAFDAGLFGIVDMNEYSRDPHAVAGALKMYLRELPNPIMTHELYDEWMSASRISDKDMKLKALRPIVERLPEPYYNNLRYLIKFLSRLSQYQDVNKMSIQNIAIVIAPNLLWSPGEDSSALGMNMSLANTYSSIVDLLITHCDWFFPGECEFYVTSPAPRSPKEGGFLELEDGSNGDYEGQQYMDGPYSNHSSPQSSGSPHAGSPKSLRRPGKKPAPPAPPSLRERPALPEKPHLERPERPPIPDKLMIEKRMSEEPELMAAPPERNHVERSHSHLVHGEKPLLPEKPTLEKRPSVGSDIGRPSSAVPEKPQLERTQLHTLNTEKSQPTLVSVENLSDGLSGLQPHERTLKTEKEKSVTPVPHERSPKPEKEKSVTPVPKERTLKPDKEKPQPEKEKPKQEKKEKPLPIYVENPRSPTRLFLDEAPVCRRPRSPYVDASEIFDLYRPEWYGAEDIEVPDSYQNGEQEEPIPEPESQEAEEKGVSPSYEPVAPQLPVTSPEAHIVSRQSVTHAISPPKEVTQSHKLAEDEKGRYSPYNKSLTPQRSLTSPEIPKVSRQSVTHAVSPPKEIIDPRAFIEGQSAVSPFAKSDAPERPLASPEIPTFSRHSMTHGISPPREYSASPVGDRYSHFLGNEEPSETAVRASQISLGSAGLPRHLSSSYLSAESEMSLNISSDWLTDDESYTRPFSLSRQTFTSEGRSIAQQETDETSGDLYEKSSSFSGIPEKVLQETSSISQLPKLETSQEDKPIQSTKSHPLRNPDAALSYIGIPEKLERSGSKSPKGEDLGQLKPDKPERKIKTPEPVTESANAPSTEINKESQEPEESEEVEETEEPPVDSKPVVMATFLGLWVHEGPDETQSREKASPVKNESKESSQGGSQVTHDSTQTTQADSSDRQVLQSVPSTTNLAKSQSNLSDKSKASVHFEESGQMQMTIHTFTPESTEVVQAVPVSTPASIQTVQGIPTSSNDVKPSLSEYDMAGPSQLPKEFDEHQRQKEPEYDIKKNVELDSQPRNFQMNENRTRLEYSQATEMPEHFYQPSLDNHQNIVENPDFQSRTDVPIQFRYDSYRNYGTPSRYDISFPYSRYDKERMFNPYKAFETPMSYGPFIPSNVNYPVEMNFRPPEPQERFDPYLTKEIPRNYDPRDFPRSPSPWNKYQLLEEHFGYDRETTDLLARYDEYKEAIETTQSKYGTLERTKTPEHEYSRLETQSYYPSASQVKAKNSDNLSEEMTENFNKYKTMQPTDSKHTTQESPVSDLLESERYKTPSPLDPYSQYQTSESPVETAKVSSLIETKSSEISDLPKNYEHSRNTDLQPKYENLDVIDTKVDYPESSESQPNYENYELSDDYFLSESPNFIDPYYQNEQYAPSMSQHSKESLEDPESEAPQPIARSKKYRSLPHDMKTIKSAEMDSEYEEYTTPESQVKLEVHFQDIVKDEKEDVAPKTDSVEAATKQTDLMENITDDQVWQITITSEEESLQTDQDINGNVAEEVELRVADQTQKKPKFPRMSSLDSSEKPEVPKRPDFILRARSASSERFVQRSLGEKPKRPETVSWADQQEKPATEKPERPQYSPALMTEGPFPEQKPAQEKRKKPPRPEKAPSLDETTTKFKPEKPPPFNLSGGKSRHESIEFLSRRADKSQAATRPLRIPSDMGSTQPPERPKTLPRTASSSDTENFQYLRSQPLLPGSPTAPRRPPRPQPPPPPPPLNRPRQSNSEETHL